MIVSEKPSLVDVDIPFQLGTADQSDYMGNEVALSLLESYSENPLDPNIRTEEDGFYLSGGWKEDSPWQINRCIKGVELRDVIGVIEHYRRVTESIAFLGADYSLVRVLPLRDEDVRVWSDDDLSAPFLERVT